MSGAFEQYRISIKGCTSGHSPEHVNCEAIHEEHRQDP